ncbi:MAG: hypothetical protein HYS22_01100 [Deltaproteobacteria bacterium]|nr:hypothetical protein [Deltaproteobacteria bacterium]
MNRTLLFFSIISLFAAAVFAFPNREKAALNLVSAQGASLLVSEDDRYLYVGFTSAIKRIDTETWLLTGDQVPDLTESKEKEADLAGNLKGLALRGGFLFASQDDGDLVKVDLSKIGDKPVVYPVGQGELGPLVADPETGGEDGKVYVADKTGNKIQVFDISAGKATAVELKDSQNKPVSPVAIAFVPFPTTAGEGGEADKIFVTSNEGLVFVIGEGGTTPALIDVDFAHRDDLSSIAVTPDGNFVLVTNSSDATVHVISTLTNNLVDTDGNAANGITPISLAKNGSPVGVAVASVSNPEDTYAFVTGTNGVSVIDLDLSGTTFVKAVVTDRNDQGASDTEDDPLAVSSTPGPVVASSDGYVYTSNINGSISVITEKPFLTIAKATILDSAGAETDKLKRGGSFTLTFSSSDTGNYSIKVGGNRSGNGTEIVTGTVDTAATDLTTASIPYDANSSKFAEGVNRVFVFQAGSGNKSGWDGIDMTVDTPPAVVTITGVDFGNESIYVKFTRLDLADMDHYNITVDRDPAVVLTKTDVASAVSQPSSGDVSEKIQYLTNGVVYYAAVEGVDKAGNVGARTNTLADGTLAFNTPEETVGLAGASGEDGGCALIPE